MRQKKKKREMERKLEEEAEELLDDGVQKEQNRDNINMEIELLGDMFWFLLGGLCYSITSSFLKIYKFVSIFKDVEASLINLLKVMDNNYAVFVRMRKG